MVVGSQVTYIMQFFLRKNLRIARDRAWDQTVKSRGKGPEFWQPYVEEWEHPPRVDLDTKQQKLMKKYLGGWFGLFLMKRGAFPHQFLSSCLNDSQFYCRPFNFILSLVLQYLRGSRLLQLATFYIGGYASGCYKEPDFMTSFIAVF